MTDLTKASEVLRVRLLQWRGPGEAHELVDAYAEAVRSDTLADVAARLPEALHATLCGPHGHPSGYDATTAAAILAQLTPDR